jgi:hypothetical protein
MKNYLNYLKGQPLKIAYLIFITLVVSGCSTQIGFYWGTYGLGVDIGLSIGVFIIWAVAAFHPYYEWKSALKEAARQQAYKDSLNK